MKRNIAFAIVLLLLANMTLAQENHKRKVVRVRQDVNEDTLSSSCNIRKIPAGKGNGAMITGKVVDKTTGEALTGASVILKEAGINIAADSLGEYRIKNLTAGKYSITAEWIGYITCNAEVEVKDDEMAVVDIFLSEILKKDPFPGDMISFPITENPGVEYEVLKRSLIEINVYNMIGTLVKVMLKEEKEKGKYNLKWDLTGEDGKLVSNGIYFIVVTADGKFINSKKITKVTQ